MKRYAIYYVPAEEARLTRLASAWLGRDAFTEQPLTPPSIAGLSADEWLGITADARMYGFHATLKPPFRLAEGRTEAELRDRLAAFAAERKAFDAPPFVLGNISRFLAVIPAEPSDALHALAAECVRSFDYFRLPPSEDELARRRRSALTERQLEYLSEWGYPYVFEDWRFHMTLTCSLTPEQTAVVQPPLQAYLAEACAERFIVDSICLFEQPGERMPFRVVERFRLA